MQGTGTHRHLAAGDHAELQQVSAPRVLVVEDDPVNQMIVQSLSEQGGFACTVAGCGAAALQRLSAEPFDAVLMDWQMPDMDGIEVTRQLRAGLAGELNRTVPVIALTANAFAEDRDICMAAGMNDFLTKVVQGTTLIATLHRWCRTECLRQETGVPAATDSSPVSDVVFDRSALASLPMVADGSRPEAVDELLCLFIATTRAGIEELPGFIASDNRKSVQRFFHTLKSSAAQIGARALSAAAMAAAAEHGLRAGESPDPSLAVRAHDELRRFESASGVRIQDQAPV